MLHIIADDVPANNTIWVLGDAILADAAGHYNFFKRKRDLCETESLANPLYMETMYAIRIISPGVYTAKQAKNTPNLILNSLVDTLNTKAKVPHTLVIMMNDNRFWNNSDLLTHQMERIIARFLKEIRRIIEARNLSLPPRAVNWDYPRIFITKALPLPNNMTKPYPRGFKANRKAYNKVLEQAEAQHNFKLINLSEFTSENDNKFFVGDGTISQCGHRNLWISISDAIHKSDNQIRINLNKVKAKQLAAQIGSNISPKETSSDLEMSDVEYINTSRDNPPKPPKPAKRALIQDFNNSDHHGNFTSSPASVASEYFTAANKQERRAHLGNQPTHHKHGHQCYHHKPSFRGKRKHKGKQNWRNPNQNWHF